MPAIKVPPQKKAVNINLKYVKYVSFENKNNFGICTDKCLNVKEKSSHESGKKTDELKTCKIVKFVKLVKILPILWGYGKIL